MESNSSVDRQNVSFKFTKTTSKALTGNRLDDVTKDFVTSIDKSEIKSTLPKPKTKELVIPLIKKNNWRTPDNTENGLSDKEAELKNIAIQELLRETSEKNAQWENREFKNINVAIPLIMQNKVPEGFETDDKMDVSLRAEESKLEDYEHMPVEQYGLAMLRGMGWKEGEGIGANNKKHVDPIQVQVRPKGLGLGADTSALKKAQKKAKDDKLELTKDAYVQVIEGPHKGFYGQVLSLDEENARAIVRLSGEEKVITLSELYVTPVSKKEFDKESRIINRASYENYKREKQKKEAQVDNVSKREKESRNAKEDRRRSENNSKEDKDQNYEKRSKKRRHSREKSAERNISKHEDKSSKPWVKPQLRVRFIDDKYKKGRYFNKKLIVVDVLSRKSCSCKTEDNKYLDDVSPSMLETVIPRDESAYVMIVQGKYTGELCTILKRDKSKCIATVQLLSDRSQALKIEYDSICEYVGDVTEFD